MAMSRRQRVRTSLHLFLVGVRRRMVLGARIALFSEGKVLLLRHTYQPGWHFPGGGVEPGETAEESARREAEEETGFRPAGALRLVGLYLHVHEATNRDHVALFAGEEVERVRVFKPNAEIAEIGWFAPEALPADVEAGTARRVAEIVGGAPVPARW
jgi:8-oxo-dGTP pyrophosphatase MutT (NUDIX family)